MTIESIGEHDYMKGTVLAFCRWFEGKELKSEQFQLPSLEKIK